MVLVIMVQNASILMLLQEGECLLPVFILCIYT